MNTNAWITLENQLALTWWDYYKWFIDDPATRGPEPPLDPFGKKAIRRLVDVDFAFRAFKKATITAKEWRLLSLWGVTKNQAEAGYAAYGDAEEGGDYGIVGYWTWPERTADYCPLDTEYHWRPAQVVQFMPDVCLDPACTATEPANAIVDVVLLAGQPPRELPQ